MTPMMWFVIAAAVAAFLIFNLLKRISVERLDAFNEKRRSSSELVSRGQIVDGRRHLDVALALTTSALIYENGDMQGSLDRKWIQEVDYEDELATGERVGSGKVLRIRCFSKTFEFVLPFDTVGRWQTALPAHH